MAEVDVKKVIKDLAKSYGDSNEDQGKMVNLMKGLAFSDDAEANKFMKALDKWTTEYADKNVKEKVMKEVNVFDKHQIKIAKDTLKMHDAGAMVMGGMNKDEARRVLKKAGYSDRQIAQMEESVEIITIEEEIELVQEDESKIILEKGDKIKVLKEMEIKDRTILNELKSVIDYTIMVTGDSYDAGEMLSNSIDVLNLSQETRVEDSDAFMSGLGAAY